jgi:hypothetical protein
MEGYRWQAQRLRVHLGVGEAFRPLGEIVEGQIERVKNGAAYDWNIGVGSAEPGLDVGGGSRGSAHRETLLSRLEARVD